MGNTVSGATPVLVQGPPETYAADLPDLRNFHTLGNTRFFKTVRADHAEGRVIVKLFIKPDANFSFQEYRSRLEEVKKKLQGCSNALPPQIVGETDRAGYIVRQEFFTSLYDRLSTRPFLNIMEKKWITYQLINAVVESHAKGVCHGDIKTENVMVTSWNWIYLTDFATAYKPVMLPEDYPADFSFYFDTTGRRTCYIAPERFYRAELMENVSPTQLKSPELTPAMDIFSLGCVIAELFLEGQRIFNLSQLLSYRAGEYDPTNVLKAIDDEAIRSMVAHMLQRDPSQRLSAEGYLNDWRNTAFPSYFATFLHQYTLSLTDPTSPVADADQRIDRMYQNFDVIAFHVGFMSPPEAENIATNKDGTGKASVVPQSLSERISLVIRLNIPNFKSTLQFPLTTRADEGALVFVSLICSSLRSLVRPSSKLKALDMLLALGAHLPDTLKLDRIVPYICTLLTDKIALVRAMALRTLTQLLCLVTNISQADTEFFPEYLVPLLSPLSEDKEPLVRITYSACLASLSETALRYLQTSYALRQEEETEDKEATTNLDEVGAPTFDSLPLVTVDNYDSSLLKLKEIMQHQVVNLLMDRDPSVNRALLADITSLCIFFGQQKADDVLQHITTFLGSHDWQLRASFFESVVGVGTYVGGKSLESFILPLMTEALADEEEFVVAKVLSSLTSLAELGLFQKTTLRILAEKIAPLLCHPGTGVRYGAISFLSSVSSLFSPADAFCLLLPLVRPFLTQPLVTIDEISLLKTLQAPLTRAVLDQAKVWARRILQVRNRASTSKQASPTLIEDDETRKRSHSQSGNPKDNDENVVTVGSPPSTSLFPAHQSSGETSVSTSPVPLGMATTPVSAEEEALRQSVRNLRLPPEDETKLLAMRGLIFRQLGNSLRPNAPGSNLPNAASTTLPVPSQTAPPMTREMTSMSVTSFVGSSTERERIFDDSFVSLKSLGVQLRKAAPVHHSRRHSASTQSQTNENRADLHHTPSTGSSAVNVPRNRVSSNNSNNAVPLQDATQTDSGDLGLASSPPRSTGLTDQNSPVTGRSVRGKSVAGSPSPSNTEWNMFFGDQPSYRPFVGPDESPRANRASRSPVAQPVASSPVNIPPLGTSVEDEATRIRNLSFAQPKASAATASLSTATAVLETVSSTSSITNPAPGAMDFTLLPDTVHDPACTIQELWSLHASQRKNKGSHGRVGSKNGVSSSLIATWRPEGVLVANLHEHQDSISAIRVSPDGAFFLSASYDGSVRLWDLQRLEKHQSNRSRSCFFTQGGRVVSIVFVDNSLMFFAASSDGSIHFCRVESVKVPDSPTQLSRIVGLRKFKVREGYAVVMEHYAQNDRSVLVYATSAGRIVALDVCNAAILWAFEHPAQSGTITSMVMDRKRQWLVVGSHRGMLTLYDLRFHLCVSTWLSTTGARINQLALHPRQPNWIVAATAKSAEVVVWNIEKSECVQSLGVPEKEVKSWWFNMQTRNTEAVPSAAPLSSSSSSLAVPSYAIPPVEVSVRAVACPTDALYALTAGTDRKIRYWDFMDPSRSFVLSGLEKDTPKPQFRRVEHHGIEFLCEEKGSESTNIHSQNRRRDTTLSVISQPNTAQPASSSTVNRRSKQIGAGHTDCITVLEIVEQPLLVISGARDGAIKVWK